MRQFQLVMAYYDNAKMLAKHIAYWRGLPHEIANNLHVTIVDDCSPNVPAKQAVVDAAIASSRGGELELHRLASLSIFCMNYDIPWNQDACRNIGVSRTQANWVLLTDMDHLVPESTWRRLMKANLDSDCAYRFRRLSEPDLSAYKPHPNTWAMHSDLYWKAGGYDEALAGNYGTDGDFLRRVQQVASVIELKEFVIRYPREVIPDASTTSLVRKDPQQKEAIQAAFRARGADWKPQHFRFPYHQVL